VQATKERNSKTQQRADLAKKLRFQGDLERLQLGRELRTEATHKRSVDNLMLKVVPCVCGDSGGGGGAGFRDGADAGTRHSEEENRVGMRELEQTKVFWGGQPTSWYMHDTHVEE